MEKKKRVKTQKLNPGWRPGRKKRRRQLAATMIQKCFRSYQLRKAYKQSRNAVKDSFQALRVFHHARNRGHWRKIDLRTLSREELRLIALSLNLPSTGKKVLLLGRIQRWVDQNILTKNLAVDAAARAHEKQVRAQGTVYFSEAVRGNNAIEIRPLRGKNTTRIAAGHECDAVYAIDEDAGSVWLCKTGGLSSQVGLCSTTHQKDIFDPPTESRWLVSPVFLHALRTEHIVRVQVARSHTVALARAGELFSWGDNPHGQLGFPAPSADQVARNRASVIAAIANYPSVSVAVGTHHTVAVCDQVVGQNGIVFTWGSNVYGQLGIPTATSPNTPSYGSKQFPKAFVMHQLDFFRGINIRKVACGSLHSMAVSEDGKLFTWGCNDGGRLGLGNITKQNERVCRPSQVRGCLEHLVVLEIACGAWHSACVATSDNQATSGRVYTWGTGVYGQLGARNTQVLYHPQTVRVPMSTIVDEEFAVQVACGMHHTSVLTNINSVYTWGSMNSFSAAPQKLRLADGTPFGKIASIACGRTFTVFNTLSLTSQSYENGDVRRMWRVKEVVVPKLNLSKLPSASLSSSCPGIDHPLPLRLEPQEDRKRRELDEVLERKRIDAIDIEAIVHPLCRVCWRCNGFSPSPLKLWICRVCFHEKELHGVRLKGTPLGKYEAVRKLQCLYRAKRAKRLLQRAREKHYQRVFSIKHDGFFYYNLWRNTVSWERPDTIPMDVEIPIRDPDEAPQIRPPLTWEEGAVVLQTNWRRHAARKECKRRLHAKYEKHFDLQKELVYYKVLIVDASMPTQRRVLWEEPPLLRRLYDLGEPIEITRLKRIANMTLDDAARIVQRRFRCHQERKRLKRMLQSRVRKLFDEETGRYYYYNIVTKQSTWTKPTLLTQEENIGQLRETRMRRRMARKEKYDSKESAARTIQALFRRFRSRKLFFDLLSRRYRKLLDEATQLPYYYDRVAGASTWLKPAVFGSFDLEIEAPTPSTREPLMDLATEAARRRSTAVMLGAVTRSQYRMARKQPVLPSISEKARRKREKRRLQKLRQTLTPDVAAGYIQRAWRSKQARHALRVLLMEAYEKIYDDATGHYYYYNKKTGMVSWEKPVLLDAQDVRETRLIKRRREYTITEPQEATVVIVGFARRCQARKELYSLLYERVQKVFDPETKQYYYFDKRTGESSWKKPLILKDNDLP